MSFFVDLPLGSLLGAGGGIGFELGMVSNPIPTIPPEIEAEVLINGSKFGTSKFLVRVRQEPINGGVNYYYLFDEAGAVREWFDNFQFFPSPGTTGFIENEIWNPQVQVRFTDWRENAQGKLEATQAQLTSLVHRVINNQGNLFDPREFDAFRANSPNAKYLTDKPNKVVVAFDESEWLPFLASTTTGTEFIFYDHNGAQLGRAALAHTPNAANNDVIGMIPVGPASINATTTWAFQTGQVTVDESVGFYVVRPGLLCQDGTVLSNFIHRVYYPIEPIYRVHRFHWLNSFGTIDSYSIYNASQEVIQTEARTFRRPLPNILTSETVGESVLQVKGTTTLQCTAENLTKGEREMFKRMVISPNLILEREGLYYNMIKEDSSHNLEDANRELTSFSFNARFSIDSISQPN